MVQKAKILLVDDRPENLLALEAILSALDQTLVRASSGEEALKALLTDDFAVILLDVQMPGMDGFETAAHIKRRERTRDIPIIFLTAINHGPHHTFRGYAAGAVDYISKPFDPWVLRAKVSVFVELYMKNCKLREQAALLAAVGGRRPGGKPARAGACRSAGRALGAAGRRRGTGRGALQAARRRVRGRRGRRHRCPSGAQADRAAPRARRVGAGDRRRRERAARPELSRSDPAGLPGLPAASVSESTAPARARRRASRTPTPGDAWGLPREPTSVPRPVKATRTGEPAAERVHEGRQR